MVRRSEQPQDSRPPSLTPAQAIRLLQGQLKKANELLERGHVDGTDVEAWKNTTREYLTQAFGSASENIDAVIYAQGGIVSFVGHSQGDRDQVRLADLKAKAKMLEGCIEQLEVRLEHPPAGADIIAAAPPSDEVFVVHGQSEEIKQTVARTLEKLGLKPIVLHEQANRGLTLLEKFLKHANVGFAVVLLTADDLGRSKVESDQNLKPRARQNVIWECGAFIGKIGRERVCVLHEPGLELPSDLAGLVYVPLDPNGAWRFGLAKELLAAGYKVDANKVL